MTGRRARRVRLLPLRRHPAYLLVLLAATLALGACGLPNGGPVGRVPSDEVPYSLLGTGTPHPSVTSDPGGPSATPQVWFVGPDQQLVAVRTTINRAGLLPLVQGLLSRLAAGPDSQQRAQGLGTALGPDVRITLVGMNADTAVVELRSVQAPSPSRLPVAVGQVVLTATSVAGVERVRFVVDGVTIPVPLPSGELTSAPVDATQYQQALVPNPTDTAKVTAPPVPPASGTASSPGPSPTSP